MTIANNTLAQLRADLDRRLNQVAAPGLWTAAEENTFLNRAILRLTMDSELDTADTAINIRVNVSWYFLPSDCLVPLFLYGPSAQWQQQKLFPTSMIALDREERLWESNSSTISTRFIPFSYNRFILWPPPRTTTTMNIHYVPVPTTLSADGDTTVLPLWAQKAIPAYGTYLALRRYDGKKARLFLAEYKQQLAVALSEKRNTTVYHTTKLRPAGKFEKSHSSPRFQRG